MSSMKRAGILIIILLLLFGCVMVKKDSKNKTPESSNSGGELSNTTSNSDTNSDSNTMSNSNTSSNSNTASNSNTSSNSNTTSNSNTSSNSNTASNSNSHSNTNTNSNSNVTPKPPEQELTVDEKVEKALSEMTLKEKIGQMIIIEYRKPYDSKLEKTLKTVKPGGFILFKENFTTYSATLNFVKKVKATSDIPMFISVDQEGGGVQRLQGLTDKKAIYIPYMQELGSTKDTKLAKEVGRVMAEEMRVFGINMDFAPVIDIYSNPKNTVIGKRAFGTDAKTVSDMALSLADGLEENGIIPVYKHFPGHGNTAVDSHVSLPIVDKSKEELYDLDLIPFQKAIENHASVIMIGHLAVPSITGDNTPASLSKKLITDFLKGEMKFNGLVVTDALNMGALTKYYSKSEIPVKAIQAGVDILLMPASPEDAVSEIVKAVQSGKIKESQIDASVRKILKLKYEKIEPTYNKYLSSSYLNSKEHQSIVNQI